MSLAKNLRANALGPNGWRPYEVELSSDGPRYGPTATSAELHLVPGFVDIHIHGAFGIDFMSATFADMVSLCEKLAEVGYEAFLPTTVSASPEDVSKALSELPQHPMIGGFHLEGPFISPKYPGAQPPEAIVEPPEGPSEWDAILDDPRLRVATIAPEQPSALQLIERLCKRGVTVSIGHTNATFEEAAAGVKAGIRDATHAFNAMRPFHHREPGAVGFMLSSNEITAELIYDRLHVSKESAALLLECKTSERVIAVSDGTMASGTGDGRRFTMWNHEVETRGGGVYLARTQTLAGSAITLLDAFRNLGADFGPEVATRLACLNPRNVLPEFKHPSVYLVLDARWDLAEIRRLA